MHKITFEPTPNPNTYRFLLPDTGLTEARSFTHARMAESYPLAKKIFGFPWASAVSLGPNFLTVTKENWVEWDILAQPLAGLIQEHLENEEPFFIELSSSESLIPLDIQESDSDLVKEIKKALAYDIRPILALDGGDVKFVNLKDSILYLSLQGACSGCPSSQITLKQGIETRIKELFPVIQEVQAI
jgi:Fe-S cluster biogenesis protein NfuA